MKNRRIEVKKLSKIDEWFKYAKGVRKDSNEIAEFLICIGFDSEDRQLAMAADPVKKGEEYTINGKTATIESVPNEFFEKDGNFLRRDFLIKFS